MTVAGNGCRFLPETGKGGYCSNPLPFRRKVEEILPVDLERGLLEPTSARPPSRAPRSTACGPGSPTLVTVDKHRPAPWLGAATPPVAWTPDREQRGMRAQRDQLPRCLARGCAVRWPDGADRPCPEHAPARDEAPRKLLKWELALAAGLTAPSADELAELERAERIRLDRQRECNRARRERQKRQAALSRIRGETQRRAAAALLDNCQRSNPVIAAEVGCEPETVRTARLRLEAEGMIAAFRTPKGTLPGTRSPNARVADSDVRKIRKLYAEGGTTQRELAVAFGVAQMTVNRIVRRQMYTDVA